LDTQAVELIPRDTLFPSWIVYALLASLIILTLVKMWRPAVFQYISETLVKPPSTIPYSRENLSFFGKSTWLLLTNYFLLGALCLYMIEVYYGMKFYWLLLAPIGYYVFQALSLFIVGKLGDGMKRLTDHFLLLNFTYHVIGLLLIPLLLMWLLNPEYSKTFIFGIGVLFAFFWLVRILRGILFAVRNKVLWYYIILYLCSLEIWPLFAIYLLVGTNFKG
jgi:hypothetical protein